MNRFKSILLIVIVFLIVGIYATYEILDNVASYNKTHDETVNDGPSVVTQAAPQQETVEETEEEIENKDQTSYIGEVTFDTNLNVNSTKLDVIVVMHKMTHQKVRAEEKRGAIPMSDDTIQQVYDVVTVNNFDNKVSLLRILDKWKNGNFKNIDENHNYFWSLQGGEVGEAYGKLSPTEEAEFIKNNFSSISQ
jgi:hypothetical protein